MAKFRVRYTQVEEATYYQVVEAETIAEARKYVLENTHKSKVQYKTVDQPKRISIIQV